MDLQSDSDDDDFDALLEETNVRRPTRKERNEQKKKEAREALLDDCILSADKSAASKQRLRQLESENAKGIDDDEFHRQVKLTSESASKKPKHTVGDISSGMDDHEDDGVFSMALKKRLAMAFDTQRSICHGIRCTIKFNPSREETLSFFRDKNDAIANLKTVVQEMDKSKSFRELVERLKRWIRDEHILINALLEGRLSMLLEEQQKLPPALPKWLFSMACSANTDDLLSEGATVTLSRLLQNGQLDKETLSCLDEVGHLLAWCDPNHWPDASVKKEDANCPSEDRNLGGLINLLAIWKISMEASPDEAIATDDANLALKSLFFMGIDPAVVSPTFSIGLQSIIRKVIRLVVTKLEKSFKPEVSREECVRCLAREILSPLIHEIQETPNGDAGGEEHYERYLTFPALIRVADLCHDGSQRSILLTMMLCEMVHVSLSKMALIDSEDNTASMKSLPEITRKVLSSASRSLEKMLDWGSNISRRAPLALAISDCVTQAIRFGLSMMDYPYTNEESKDITKFLEKCMVQVETMSGRFLGIGQNIYMQFLDRHWTTYKQYLREVGNRISRSPAPGSPVQRTLTSYMHALESPDSVADTLS